ncbi:MAG: hypothetical protein AB7E32_13005 [Desulfovibrio sp.]
MKYSLVATMLLLLLTALPIAAMAGQADGNASVLQNKPFSIAGASEMNLSSDAVYFRNFNRSGSPLGNNMVSAARSIPRIETLRQAKQPDPPTQVDTATFEQSPSGAAIALLLMALLMLPFMGRTEAH